ncbi:unnamed protein product [Rhizophagus irregularis]|nr:unnamed protein product [Rhizophagus irregularis]
MKFLKEWIFEIGERINDNIDYFIYNEFRNLEEIDEETVNGTFKKADLENQRITVVIKILNNPKINENDFKEFITKLKAFHKINHPNINRFLGLTRGLEDPIESTPLEYQKLYQKCWHNSPDIRPEINEVHEILSQLNLRFKIFNDLLTKQQIIKKFKLNYGLILTEDNATPSMKEIFEDGELNMSLYEEQPIVYVNINMNDLRSADACINFPIAEITYDGDLLETFDHNDESFGHFFARKILVGSKLFIKGFSSASQTQIDVLKFYLFCAYNSSKYSTEIQFNKLFGLNLLPKIVTLGGEELNTHEKLIEWMNNLYQNKMIDIISYSLIPISQLGLKKLLLIDELESFNEKQPGVVNFKEKLNLKKWIGNAMYDNLVNWANNLHLFKGLIINEDYKIRISKKIAVNLNKFPEVNLISDRTYPKMIMPSTNLEVILISNNIFSIKDLSTFPFIKKNVKNYEDYIHILFKNERYEILFNKDHIKPTKEFEQLIESALNSLKPLKALQDIFNEYGHLFPQRIILGKSLKNISPNTTSKIDLEHLTFDDLNVTYLLTREGEVVKKNDLYDWIQKTNNNLEIIEFDKIIPFYKLLEVDQQRKIDNILKNNDRIIMTGIANLKDLDSNNIVHYKRINLNSESVLEDEDYEVIGSIISEDNIKLEEICVNFGLFDFSGFYAIIKKLKETSFDIKKCYVLWMIVGNPSKLSVLSPNNREFQVDCIKESIKIQSNKANYYIKIPFPLSLGYTISVHAYYSSSNYEPFNIIKLVEWNYKFINIQITHNESTTGQGIISNDNFDEYKNSLTNFEVDLHICILSTNCKNLKIDDNECEHSLDLIGYILTKENLNERLEDEIDKSASNIQNTAKGNGFGREIEFREGFPIQLLNYRENSENEKFGQIALNPEALNILREINEPLAIISVVGSYRRGKSWFANVLHGRHDGFELGAKVGGCTRGIYMWSPPFKLESKQSDGEIIQKRVIVLDSEGIDDPKQDGNWAKKLFILCLVVSSTFIYNINGIVGRNDIGKLYLMTDLSKFIQEPKNGDFLPKLVILLRDFTLEQPESFKDYFLDRLKNIYIEVAMGINQFFYDFGVYGLPHPGCKRKMLQHMEDAITDELDEEFVEEVENAVKSIYSQLSLKYIGPSTMQGISFVKFLENIVERMNSSETLTLLSIPFEYEIVIQYVAQEAIKESIRKYNERTNTLINEEGKLPMLWEEFEKMHHEYISEANKTFFEKVIGSPKQIRSFVEHLHEKLFELKKLFMEINSKELLTYNENIAKKFWANYIENKTENNSFKDNEEFQEALKSFELAYYKSMKKSPEANKVITSYKQNQYSIAVDHMTQLGKMNERLAEELHTREEADRLRQEALVLEETIRIRTEAFERDREKFKESVEIKMSELLKNIEQQKNLNEEMKQRFIEERDSIVREFDLTCDEIRKDIKTSRDEKNHKCILN